MTGSGDMESFMRTLPPDVDPFAYVEKAILAEMALNASQYITGILTAFLVFHAMIFIFCMFILIMSSISGAQQARWLVKSLYIKDQSGERVYQSPLYFFNAGILMAAWKLIGSVASAAYIWIQIQSSESVTNQVVHAKIVPPLAIMFVFEILSYWTLTHCFLVTVYVSRQFNPETKKGVMRCLSAPIIINTFFGGFAICLTSVVAGLATWTTSNHHRFAVESMQILDLLKQGSRAWKLLHGGKNLSSEEISQISAPLAEKTFMLKKITSDIVPHVEELSRAFHWCIVIMFAIACTTFAAFIPVFCLLVRKYQRSVQSSRSSSVVILPCVDHSPNWLKQENIGNSGGINRVSGNPSSIRLFMMNKQFVYLIMRALGVFLSMIFLLVSLCVMLIKTREVIAVKYCRDFTTWIVIAGGAWSAIPIAWQCWRLYIDQINSGSPSKTSNFLPKNALVHNIQHFRTHQEIEREIKLPDR